jgi:hypothetical protein
MHSTKLYFGAYLGFLGWMVLLDMFLTGDAISGFKNKRILTFSVKPMN